MMQDANLWTAIITAGAVVGAVSLIWMKGVKPSAQWLGDLVETLRELVSLIREMRDFLRVERDAIRRELAHLRTDVDELTQAAMDDSVTLHAALMRVREEGRAS